MSALDLDALIDGAGRVADLEAEIPQHVEHVLGDALAPRRLLVGKQEQQIDVGAGRQQRAAIAAGGDDRHALGVRRVGRPVDVRHGVVVRGRGSARPGSATDRRRSGARCDRPRGRDGRQRAHRRRAPSGARSWRRAPCAGSSPCARKFAVNSARSSRESK